MSRLSPSNLRAAWWAQRALAKARRELQRTGIAHVEVEPPPSLPDSAIRGVRAVTRRRPSTCLERSLVLQAWFSARGIDRDVIVGVTAPGEFRAHAWLEGDDRPHDAQFAEILRRRPTG